MDDDNDILLDHPDPQLAVVTLNRPERLNALSHGTVRRLCATLDALQADEAVRAVVLTGAGRAFCAGWDLASALTDGAGAAIRGEPTVADRMRGQDLFVGIVKRLREMDKVVIAAVNGAALGAGLGMVLACDLRIAARTASFHVGAVRIGLTAGECGISYHLPRLVGAARAFELMLTGRPVKADEAERIGLVSTAVHADLLLTEALGLARQVLHNSPYATRHTKEVMWANLEAGSLSAALELENRAQVLALMTEDFREASTAFTEKRAPRFTGR